MENINNNDHNNNNNHSIKRNRHSRGSKRRLKSSVVRDVNGSSSTFKQFYQSGGRDYEQYRLWLQALPRSDKIATSSVESTDLEKIKEEPIEMKYNVVTAMPFPTLLPPPPSPSSSSVNLCQTLSTQRNAHTYSLFKPIQHLSLPIKSQLSLQVPIFSSSLSTTTSFEPHTHFSYDCSNVSSMPASFSPSLNTWSVQDVGRFIEKHFPERNIAEKFIQEKIDGRTLQLLTEDHLTRVFKMKLGPALYLLALISSMQRRS